MKKILNKNWVKMILLGLVIGGVFILLDNKLHIWNGKSKKEDLYNGPISIEKDKTYVTTAEYSGFEYDFGKVKEGDTVSHVFQLKNTGKEPLIIYKSTGSCECIAAFYTSGKSIMPDSTADISVFFKTKGRKGPQSKSVEIITNTDPAAATIVFKGEVE